MSVHKKLMEARLRLQATALKKSGWNPYSEFKYFEMADFLPVIQTIFSELSLCGVVSCTPELAKLTITDFEDGTSLEITAPFGSAKLKASHEVQNVGACVTYQRRYLWMTALEIVEHDAVDASAGVEPEKKPEAKKVSPVRPNSAGEDFWNNAQGDEKAYLNSCLSDVRDYLDDNQPGGAAQVFYGMNDMEEQAAVWSQLGSKERAAIKACKPQPALEKAA